MQTPDEPEEEDEWLSSRRPGQSKEEAIYGVFLDDEPESWSRTRKSFKHDLKQPMNFVRAGVIKPGKLPQQADEDDDDTGHGGLGFKRAREEPDEGEEGDEPEEGEEGEESEEEGEEEEEKVHGPQPAPPGAPKKAFTVVLPPKKDEEENRPVAPEAKRARREEEGLLPQDFGAFLDGGPARSAVWSMLKGMGFRGRLGKEEQGMSEAIAVKLRPPKLGLGSVDEKTEQQKRWERELRIAAGEEAADDAAQIGSSAAPERLASADRREQRRGAWRKDAAPERTKAKALKDIVQQVRKEKIIDMRGPQPRVLESMSQVNDTTPVRAPAGSLQELRHNVDLLVQLTEMEIQAVHTNLQREEERLASLQKEQEVLDKQTAQRNEFLEELSTIAQVVQKVYDKVVEVPDSENLGRINLQSLAQVFENLKGRYYESYNMYSVNRMGVCLAVMLLRKSLQAWQPFDEPEFCVSDLTTWQQLLYEDTSTEGELYVEIINQAVYPKLRNTLQSEWSVLDQTDLAVDLLDKWHSVLPVTTRSLLYDLVATRILAQVDEWTPKQLPLHVWVLPWLTHLQVKLEEIGAMAKIRHRLAKAVARMDILEPATYETVVPWVRVFSQQDISNFFEKVVIPRLTVALNGIRFVPGSQDFAAWDAAMIWTIECIPADRMATLLAQEFFTKLLYVLEQVLNAASEEDFDTVIEWYSAWKARVPAVLQKHPIIQQQWDAVLNLMQAAGESNEQLAGEKQPVDIDLINQRAHTEAKTQHIAKEQERRLADLQKRLDPTDSWSFKEMIEHFAEENNMPYAPKKGNPHHNGKPIYSFGKVSCYVDNNIVYTLDGDRWKASTLEQLLAKALARR
eukprot:TRINITY_DN32479_c0_g1_i1.p1 TRINITY_DN32479_c0_g1~~TRINITY_DN32479_c0_g1_i1.p1  ORF type:complete len:858 (+),score=196.01 TRINITY_DN32479_c0_g1_i1:22-2574(+)